jgi:hypothetical protein
MAVNRSLTMLIYGESGAGKSSLAATAPYPRLMLDVETGHRFLPISVRYWNPFSEPAPIADGTWDTCVVSCDNYAVVLKAYQVLRSGQHQFRSLIIDSVSELQVKLLDQLVGTEQVKMQQWGDVLRQLGGLLRDVRDLTMHPTNPLEAVVLTAMAKADKEGKFHPYLQGQLAVVIPYFYDIMGALVIETYPNPDPTQPAQRFRRLYVEGTNKYEAKERVQGRLGQIVEQDYLNIDTMITAVFGPRPELAQSAQAIEAPQEPTQ